MDKSSRPKLKLFSLSMVVISLVVGMGIFKTASVTANASLSPEMFFFAWIAGGVIALCGALTYAEIGSRYPITGGYYRIFSVAYHPAIAFAMNGTILVSNAAALGGVALIGSDYLCSLILDYEAGPALKSGIAVTAILAFYIINLRGLKFSSTALNILMIIKITMMLMIIAALFFPEIHADPSPVHPLVQNKAWTDYLWAFGAALVAVSFTYGGYQHAINFGEEVDNAPSTMPRGIIIGMSIVFLLYLLMTISYYKVIGFEELKDSSGIASLVIYKLLGSTGEKVFTGMLVLAVMTYVNVNLLSNPRIMYAMSLDGLLPKIFSMQHPSSQVFVVSLTVFACSAVVITFFAETFDKVLGFVMILDSIGMAASAATLFYFRRKTSSQSNSNIYSTRFYPFIPLLFIGAYLFVGMSCMYLYPHYGVIAAIVFFGLTGIYFLLKKPASKADKNMLQE